MEEHEAIAAGIVGLSSLLLALSRVQARRTHAPETLLLLGVAFTRAGERGHRECTVPHVALALLSDPEAAGLLEQRGASLEAIYADLERLLPARNGVPVTLKPGDYGAGVANLLRARPVGALSVRPRHLLAELLGSQHLGVRSVFEKHGITAARLRKPPTWIGAPASDDAAMHGALGPYRAAPTINAPTDVLLWNDSKTTMEFVVEALGSVFGIVEPRASALMLMVHREGVATVGTYEREQAELLVATTLRLAHARGFSLRVTAHDASRRETSPRVARWLRRWRTLMEKTLAPETGAAEASSTEPSWTAFGAALACPSCGEASKRYRKLPDALVCTACGRSAGPAEPSGAQGEASRE